MDQATDLIDGTELEVLAELLRNIVTKINDIEYALQFGVNLLFFFIVIYMMYKIYSLFYTMLRYFG